MLSIREADGARQAAELFADARARAGKHPLVLYSSALLILAKGEYPRKAHWAEGQTLMAVARQMDPEQDKFAMAEEAFIRWGIVVAPTCPRSRLLYALVQQCINDKFDEAEKAYRKAMTLGEDAPLPQVRDNYEDFIKERMPGGLYAFGGPTVGIKERSRVVDTSVDLEWHKCENPMAATSLQQTFWRSVFTGEASWTEPDWETVWDARRSRSTKTSRTPDGADQYLDPLTGHAFYYWIATGNCVWEAQTAPAVT